GGPGDDRRRLAHACAAVHGDGDAEPDRVRGDVSTSRGAARPLHDAARARLSAARRRGEVADGADAGAAARVAPAGDDRRGAVADDDPDVSTGHFRRTRRRSLRVLESAPQAVPQVTDGGRLTLLFGLVVYIVAWIFGSQPLYPVAVGLALAPLLGWAWVRLAA